MFGKRLRGFLKVPDKSLYFRFQKDWPVATLVNDWLTEFIDYWCCWTLQ